MHDAALHDRSGEFEPFAAVCWLVKARPGTRRLQSDLNEHQSNAGFVPPSRSAQPPYLMFLLSESRCLARVVGPTLLLQPAWPL